MMWVKVCGITREIDLAAAAEAGADAVGFVMVPGSPRRIPGARVRSLVADSPVATYVLTLDLDPGDVPRLLADTGADGIQPYGVGAMPAAAAALSLGARALVSGSPGDVGWMSELPPLAIPLLDTPSEAVLGGTGRAFDWSGVAAIERDLVIAGGLGPENVARAILASGAWGVDASSRLESKPGIKDPGRVAAFVEEARST